MIGRAWVRLARSPVAAPAVLFALVVVAAAASFPAGVAVAAVSLAVLRPRWPLVLGAALGCFALAPVAALAVGERAANALAVLVLGLVAVAVVQLVLVRRAER